MSDLTQATLNLQAAASTSPTAGAISSDPTAAGPTTVSSAHGPSTTAALQVESVEAVAGADPTDFAFHLALQPKDDLPGAPDEGADLNEVISQVMGARDAQEAQPQVRERKSRRNPAPEGDLPELACALGQELRELQELMGLLTQDMSGAAAIIEQITFKSGELTSLLLQAATKAQSLSQRSGQVLLQLKARH